MARSQANLQFGVFRGLAGLSLQAKLLYLAILVDPAVNQSGVGVLRLSRWARELEVEHGDAAKALAELDAARFVLADYDTDEILVRTLIRNDGVADQPNVLLSALRHAVLCESPRLRRALAAELRRLPPKPPDKVHPTSGRRYVYPDPHAVADELDPRPPSGGGEPFREPFVEPFREGFPNRDEPGETRRLPGRVPGRDVGRLGGGGGGGGGSSSDVATQVENTHTAPREPETDPAAVAAARATRRRDRADRSRWRTAPPQNGPAYALAFEHSQACAVPLSAKLRGEWGAEIHEWLQRGYTPDQIRGALADVRAAGYAHPGALEKFLVSAANRRAAPARLPLADRAAAETLAAFERAGITAANPFTPPDLPDNVRPLPRAITEGA